MCSTRISQSLAPYFCFFCLEDGKYLQFGESSQELQGKNKSEKIRRNFVQVLKWAFCALQGSLHMVVWCQLCVSHLFIRAKCTPKILGYSFSFLFFHFEIFKIFLIFLFEKKSEYRYKYIQWYQTLFSWTAKICICSRVNLSPLPCGWGMVLPLVVVGLCWGSAVVVVVKDEVIEVVVPILVAEEVVVLVLWVEIVSVV